MKETALLLIDIQNDYFTSFKNNRWPLVGMEAAAGQAQRLLAAFRRQNLPVIHVRHEALNPNIPFFQPETDGADIHEMVAPLEDEKVVLKHKANSFYQTDLCAHLQDHKIKHLVVVGAMTQNCIDSTVRAAVDLGFTCSVVDDACATRDLTYEGRVIAASDVQACFMASLGFAFAAIEKTDDVLAKLVA